jgi:hypothetical protein
MPRLSARRRINFPSSRRLSRCAAVALAILASGYAAMSLNPASSMARDEARTSHAHYARTQSVKDEARMHLVTADGNTLIEEGKVTGNLPGSAHVSLDIGTTTATCKFTLYLNGGSITGQGVARLNTSSDTYFSFGGSASIQHGSGHYANISGKGDIYGVLNRENNHAEVQLIGTLQP